MISPRKPLPQAMFPSQQVYNDTKTKKKKQDVPISFSSVTPRKQNTSPRFRVLGPSCPQNISAPAVDEAAPSAIDIIIQPILGAFKTHHEQMMLMVEMVQADQAAFMAETRPSLQSLVHTVKEHAVDVDTHLSTLAAQQNKMCQLIDDLVQKHQIAAPWLELPSEKLSTLLTTAGGNKLSPTFSSQHKQAHICVFPDEEKNLEVASITTMHHVNDSGTSFGALDSISPDTTFFDSMSKQANEAQGGVAVQGKAWLFIKEEMNRITRAMTQNYSTVDGQQEEGLSTRAHTQQKVSSMVMHAGHGPCTSIPEESPEVSDSSFVAMNI